MRRLLTILWLCLGTAAHVATAAEDEVRWQSVDGRSFEGVYLGTDPGTSQALFAGPAGSRLAVDPAKLTASARARLAQLAASQRPARAAAAMAPFRPAPAPDRSALPRLNQGEFGKLNNDCVPNVLAAFLLWWERQGLLPVPRRGDPRAKATWLHEKLAEYCATNEETGTATRDTHRGLKTYFTNHLAGLAALRVATDYDCSPANLARYPVGPAACLLTVTMYYGDAKQGGHVVALLSAKPDGSLTFRTWGLDFHGKLRVLEKRPGTLRRGMGKVDNTVRAIDLTTTAAARLPEWFRQLQIRFVVDPVEWDGITIAVPYLYQKQPGTAPAPPDPLFEGPVTFDRDDR